MQITGVAERAPARHTDTMQYRSSLALIFLAACGGGPSGGPSTDAAGTGDAATAIDATTAIDAATGGCPTTGRYLPLATGRSWTYRVTDVATGAVKTKTQVVGALENITAVHAGVMAYKVTTTQPGGTTESWQQDTGSAIRRHKENDNAGATASTTQFDPYRTRVDETPAHVVAGAQWSESYTELVTVTGMAQTTAAKNERWNVVAVDEPVTVPAGTFCTLHLHRVSTVGGMPGSDKQYWFARGVGKIKEAGATQVEELTGHTP